jgi:DNA repair protein RadA/Sms
MLAEVQSLVASVAADTPPRRVTHGVDGSRVAMILAVLQRRANFGLSRHDVYVSTVGGARILDPAADLALAIAIASAGLDEGCHRKVIALGEIGLAGDLRRVPGLEQRVGEAARLGFELALVPAGNRDPNNRLPRMHGLKVVEVATVAEALGALGLRRSRSSATRASVTEAEYPPA